jgi:hypothetical protein
MRGVEGIGHDAATRKAISEGVILNQSLRTPEQRRELALKRSDAVVCKMWVFKGPRYGSRKGRKMDGNTPVGQTTLAKIEKASIKRIIKDLATTDPELFREAIVAGLQAAPPRSFPYLALAAAYLDGKPIDAEPPISSSVDLSQLTQQELKDRAYRLVRLFEKRDLVIEGTVIKDPADMSPEELQEEIRKAQLEVEKAQAEVDRIQAEGRVLR